MNKVKEKKEQEKYETPQPFEMDSKQLEELDMLIAGLKKEVTFPKKKVGAGTAPSSS